MNGRMLVLPIGESRPGSVLSHYCFAWGRGTVALALGYGSLYNHSYRPNARYDDVGPQTKEFTALRDIERGLSDRGEPYPWQTDTCIGAWHYKRGIRYKSAELVVRMLGCAVDDGAVRQRRNDVLVALALRLHRVRPSGQSLVDPHGWLPPLMPAL